MKKISTFKYSAFYILQPFIGVAILCFALFMMVYFRSKFSWEGYGFIAWIILLCFVIFAILKSLWIIFRRINEPVGVKLSEESISVIYRNGESTQLFWANIEKIRIRRDRWRFGAESIEITSKENSRGIIINDDINKYKILRNAIIEKKKERTEIE